MDGKELGLSAKEALVLRLLIGAREMYGLEMVKASGGGLKRGSVYVFLSNLEDKGFVSSRKEASEDTQTIPRRLYKVTGLGQRALAAWESRGERLAGEIA